MPNVIDNFENLTDNEKKNLCRLAIFFCGLHALIHLAEVAEKSILQVEKNILTEEVRTSGFIGSTEASTVRLIRTSCKAFAAGADEKSGVFSNFIVYVRPFLKENSMRSLPIVQFRGSRFNILFQNASGVFFLKEKMVSFLDQHGADNRLTKAVAADLKVPELLAGCKALGLICRLVTQPLWSTLEDKSIHILDMNKKYSELLDFFTTANDDIALFMKGGILPFGDDTYVHEDQVYRCLVADDEYDDVVETFLHIIFPALAVLSQKQFKDHLEGGIHSNLSTADTTSKERYQSTPKHNKYAESVFGLLDFLLKQKPNITTLAGEAYIMFSQNKTMAWLQSKSAEEQDIMIKNARKSTDTLKRNFNSRRQEIKRRKNEQIKKTILQREEAETRRLQKKVNSTNNMIHFGRLLSKLIIWCHHFPLIN